MNKAQFLLAQDRRQARRGGSVAAARHALDGIENMDGASRSPSMICDQIWWLAIANGRGSLIGYKCVVRMHPHAVAADAGSHIPGCRSGGGRRRASGFTWGASPGSLVGREGELSGAIP